MKAARRERGGFRSPRDAREGPRARSVDPGSTETNRIDRFLSILPKRNGSDLHLAVGSPPVVRIDGDLERIRYRALTEGDFYNLVGPIAPARAWSQFADTGDVDFAYQMGSEASVPGQPLPAGARLRARSSGSSPRGFRRSRSSSCRRPWRSSTRRRAGSFSSRVRPAAGSPRPSRPSSTGSTIAHRGTS